MMKFSLTDNKIPIFTVKKTAWKVCLNELLWFIKGETDNLILHTKNVHIWDKNASKDFMKTRNLDHYPEGILGPIYGYQWRHFNNPYNFITGKRYNLDSSVINKTITQPYGITNIRFNIDQLQYIIDNLKDPEKRSSRRLIMTSWNPCQLDDMVLPPCHVLCQFNVHNNNKLSCALYQRSGDVALGICFNIASYSFLTHLLAKHCGLEAYEFVYFLGNAHIYEEHLENMKELFDREPYDFPTINIVNKKENINDYDSSDFEILNYFCHNSIKMDIIV